MPPADTTDVDEDDVVIAACREVDAALILAPRKPERFDLVAQKLETAGIPYVRRTLLNAHTTERVLLLDTIGELSGLFSLADTVFMGGTLARRGGHNILEPAWFAKPVIVGPHMENFQAIADDFRAAGASVEIPDASALAGAVRRLLEAREVAGEIGRKALACAAARRGATALVLEEIRGLYTVPCYRPAQPWFAIRWVLAHIWKWGGKRKLERSLRARQSLDVPVVSVGNLTLGGTGKTPLVLHLAQAWKTAWTQPGYSHAGTRPQIHGAYPGDGLRARTFPLS